ncbi:hypothetical protein HDE_06209 [Halotydeus destructor]|nr:hypothetical protein HDE_06209 [Halotydeus destructor]
MVHVSSKGLHRSIDDIFLEITPLAETLDLHGSSSNYADYPLLLKTVKEKLPRIRIFSPLPRRVDQLYELVDHLPIHLEKIKVVLQTTGNVETLDLILQRMKHIKTVHLQILLTNCAMLWLTDLTALVARFNSLHYILTIREGLGVIGRPSNLGKLLDTIRSGTLYCKQNGKLSMYLIKACQHFQHIEAGSQLRYVDYSIIADEQFHNVKKFTVSSCDWAPSVILDAALKLFPSIETFKSFHSKGTNIGSRIWVQTSFAQILGPGSTDLAELKKLADPFLDNRVFSGSEFDIFHLQASHGLENFVKIQNELSNRAFALRIRICTPAVNFVVCDIFPTNVKRQLRQSAAMKQLEKRYNDLRLSSGSILNHSGAVLVVDLIAIANEEIYAVL